MMRYLLVLFVTLLCSGALLSAHPMPNSVLLLDVKDKGVAAELGWPLKELQLVFPSEDIDGHANTLLGRRSAWLDDYLLKHLYITDSSGARWTIAITGKTIIDTEQSFTGKFRQLRFLLWLQPPAGSSPRHFIMHYDAIMHQVVTHKMLIRIRHDWAGGLSEKDSADADLGALMMNTNDNRVPPVIVNLDEGSNWKGFVSMLRLGIEHISEGTDHLLFLLVLLLPAPLLATGKRWTVFGGTRYSIVRLLKITAAFTVGHSVTLLAGALGWLRLPAQPVELLIAVSILITAVHALRPLFPGREVYIASGFGLIHGLAFARVIADLDLQAGKMALSILGFNLGIEAMQLFVILLFIPWLIILSQYRVYTLVRVTGALFAGVAAISWIVERTTGKLTPLSPVLQSLTSKGIWIVIALAIPAITFYLLQGLTGKGKVRVEDK